MDKRTKIRFIVNPISGTGDKRHIVAAAARMIPDDSFQRDVVYTSYKGHAAEIAEQSAREGWDVVVAVGGDGTVNEVARSLVHTDTALGIVPCGSGNGLARHLSIPMNPVGALKVLRECKVETLDYGLINETPFFCTCGVGFDAFVSSKFAESGKRGLLSYLENTLKEGLLYKPETYDIEIDGEKQHYKAFLIACANASQYGNNVYIAPMASMSDGLLDVTIMEPFTVLEAPQIAIQLFNKSITSNSRIRTFQCHSLHIHRTSPGVIHFDGEPVEEGRDLYIRLEDKAIRMVVNNETTALQPPLLRMFSDFYSEMNGEIENLKQGISDGSHKIKAINKELLRKLRLGR